MARVHLKNVSKVFANGTRAVDGVELAVEDGELLALVGASGSGKTTLLRLIAGLDTPTSGSVEFDGRNVTTWPAWRRGTSLVAESSSLLPHRSVAENLLWSRRQRRAGNADASVPGDTNTGDTNTGDTNTGAGNTGAGNTGAGNTGAGRRVGERGSRWNWWTSWRRWREARGFTTSEGSRGERDKAEWRAMEEMAERLGLGELLERLPTTLSAGQQQRVALGRALLAAPPVMLLDEPLGRLDGPQRTRLARELRAFQRRSKSLASGLSVERAAWIYVTHDRQEAVRVADRIAMLENGRLLQVGTPFELSSHPEWLGVARWMAERPLNVLAGRTLRGIDAVAAWSADDAVISRDGPAGSRRDKRSKWDKQSERDKQSRRDSWGRDSLTRDSLAESLPGADAGWIWVSGRVEGIEVSDSGALVWVERTGVSDEVGAVPEPLCVWLPRAADSGEIPGEPWEVGVTRGVGEVVHVGFDLARAHWFDSASGRRISAE